jgi:tRNA nucleotidyltransferase/poly(A) polymerase
VQVTTLRVEALYRDHRRPHQVTFTKSIEEDLQRRDFTVNAMAYRIETGQWKDPFHGRQDILDKKLKSVGNAFDRMEEDALRILRAYRFMAQYDFTLDQELERAMTDSRDLLHHLPVERIMQEMHALLLAPHALQSLQSMQRVGLFSSILTSNIQSDVGFDRVAPSLILRMWYLMDLHKNLQVDQLNAWGLSKQQSKTLKQLEQLRLEPLAAKQKLWWLAWAKRLNIQHLASSLEVMDCAKIATWLRTFERQGHFELFQQFPVNGQALMKVLKLEPSKRVGEMLQALKEYYVERPDQLAGKSVETLIQNWYNASL